MTISKNFKTLQNGLHIYTAGVALQEFFIFCFLFLVYKFQRRLSRECPRERVLEARKLLNILYISLGLISVSFLLSSPTSHFLSSLLTFHLVPYSLPHHRILGRRRYEIDTRIPCSRSLPICLRRNANVLCPGCNECSSSWKGFSWKRERVQE